MKAIAKETILIDGIPLVFIRIDCELEGSDMTLDADSLLAFVEHYPNPDDAWDALRENAHLFPFNRCPVVNINSGGE